MTSSSVARSDLSPSDPRTLMPRDTNRALAGIAAVVGVSLVYARWLHVGNSTTVALSLLLVVLIVAATSHLWTAVVTSIAALACFNFFFIPPVGTLTIADPQNWVALLVFLAVSLVASNLSSVARARAMEALARRDEMARLFDLSRDILLMTESKEAIPALARLVGRRFDLDYIAICLPDATGWSVAEAGSLMLTLDDNQLSMAMTSGEAQPTFDVRGRAVRLVSLRFGTRPIGLLAVAGRPIEPGTIDALGGVVAIAIERAQFLEERKSAELARQSEELKSALLASLGHDLRTPLTTIRVAATNLQATWLTDDERRDQSTLVVTEVERLARLFQNILEMARIDAGAVGSELRWVHPSEIIAGARDQIVHTLGRHELSVEIDTECLVRVDPRLTAAALAHLLENAAQYAPEGSPILVKAAVTDEGFVLSVRDSGPGIAAQDLPHLFDRFYRGTAARSRVSGTGMGLSIARGLLAVERGRIRAQNCPGGGAQFTIVVPAHTRSPEPGAAAEAAAGQRI